MAKIRVLIVDDQKLFAKSLRVVLEQSSNGEITIVGVAYGGREALAMIPKVMPHIMLIDIRMPDIDGVELTRLVRRKHPEIKIIILTTFDDDDYVFNALQSGAVGYILKDMEPEELVSSVKAVHSGTVLFSPTVGSRIITQAVSAASQERSGPDRTAEVNYLLSQFSLLSRREAEVLDLILQNLDNQEIADRLFIAQQTVKNYTSRIYAKLGVRDRMHAIQMVVSREKNRES